MEHERAAKQLQDDGLYKDMTFSALVKKVCYQDWTEATDDVKQQCFDQAIGSIVTEKTGRLLNGMYQELGLIPDETMLAELIPDRRLDRIPQKEFAKVGKSLIKVLGEFGKKKNNSKHMRITHNLHQSLPPRAGVTKERTPFDGWSDAHSALFPPPLGQGARAVHHRLYLLFLLLLCCIITIISLLG